MSIEEVLALQPIQAARELEEPALKLVSHSTTEMVSRPTKSLLSLPRQHHVSSWQKSWTRIPLSSSMKTMPNSPLPIPWVGPCGVANCSNIAHLKTRCVCKPASAKLAAD